MCRRSRSDTATAPVPGSVRLGLRPAPADGLPRGPTHQSRRRLRTATGLRRVMSADSGQGCVHVGARHADLPTSPVAGLAGTWRTADPCYRTSCERRKLWSSGRHPAVRSEPALAAGGAGACGTTGSACSCTGQQLEHHHHSGSRVVAARPPHGSVRPNRGVRHHPSRPRDPDQPVRSKRIVGSRGAEASSSAEPCLTRMGGSGRESARLGLAVAEGDPP